MVERIIVAVDGGPASDAALDWLIERAPERRVEIRVTSVLEPGSHETERRALHEAAVVDAGHRLRLELPAAHTVEVVRRGGPADTLLQDAGDADLLIIGAHATGMLAGLLRSTLSLVVAGHTNCTTVVVPEGWRPTGGGIVVAWDGDGSAEAALAFAAREAVARDTDLTILHVWTTLPGLAFDAIGSAIVLDEHIDTQRRALAAAAERVRLAHPTLVVVEQFEPGPVVRSVRRAANGASLLVVGSHGRTALGGILLGSVSRDILVALPCPVAVVPGTSEPLTAQSDALVGEIR